MRSYPIYVLGFYFSKNSEHVLLIHKSQDKGPLSVRGKWNGVGGKVEKDETIITAMRREFKEETGIETFNPDWELKTWIFGAEDSFEINIFAAFGNPKKARQMEAEEIGIFVTNRLPDNLASHTAWLIPLLLDRNIHLTKFNEAIQ